MSFDVMQAADGLVRSLAAHGVKAESFTVGPAAGGVNIWGVATRPARYVASVSITAAGLHDEYAWGGDYEHTCPLETPYDEVAVAILGTLGAGRSSPTQSRSRRWGLTAGQRSVGRSRGR